MARVRKDVWGLGAGWSDTLEWYAKAVRTLQSRAVTDRTSWRFLAAIHGMHPVVWREFGVIQANTPLPTARRPAPFLEPMPAPELVLPSLASRVSGGVRRNRSRSRRSCRRARRLGAALLELQRLDSAKRPHAARRFRPRDASRRIGQSASSRASLRQRDDADPDRSDVRVAVSASG